MPFWFKYKQLENVDFMPFLDLELRFGEKRRGIEFLVDSGAARSFVPKWLVTTLVGEHGERLEEPSGLIDANGEELTGVPLDFEVSVIDHAELPRLHQYRIWISENVAFPLLGQNWFEKMGVTFWNFPHAIGGRRFLLFPPRG